MPNANAMPDGENRLIVGGERLINTVGWVGLAVGMIIGWLARAYIG